MPADATPTVIAHEFGHVIGLGDDRDDAGNPVGPDPKGIMVGGANGVTPNTKLKIGKNHVDRIGQQLANLGKITCGQAWKGTLNGTGVNDSRRVPGRHDDQRPLLDDCHAGRQGDDEHSLGDHRGLPATVGLRRVRLHLGRKRTSSQISFAPSADLFPWPLDLRVRGDRATGSITFDSPAVPRRRELHGGLPELRLGRRRAPSGCSFNLAGGSWAGTASAGRRWPGAARRRTTRTPRSPPARPARPASCIRPGATATRVQQRGIAP